jgi:hypothetical protein
MRRSIIFSVVAVFLAIALSSCQKDPVLTIDASSLEMAATGMSKSVSITSNYPWVATSSDSWITLSSYSGAEGSSTISVSVSSTDKYDTRTGSVTIITSSKEPLSKTISVTQSQKNDILLTSDKENVGYEGGEITVDLQTNVKYGISISSDVDWIKEVKTKGLSAYKHTFEIACNREKVARQAYITFKDPASSISAAVLVTQTGSPSTFVLRHNAGTLEIPYIDGLNVDGTVDWGDGVSQAYDLELTHIYSLPGEYIMNVEVTGASSVFLNSITGISHIDISNF